MEGVWQHSADADKHNDNDRPRTGHANTVEHCTAQDDLGLNNRQEGGADCACEDTFETEITKVGFLVDMLSDVLVDVAKKGISGVYAGHMGLLCTDAMLHNTDAHIPTKSLPRAQIAYTCVCLR